MDKDMGEVSEGHCDVSRELFLFFLEPARVCKVNYVYETLCVGRRKIGNLKLKFELRALCILNQIFLMTMSVF